MADETRDLENWWIPSNKQACQTIQRAMNLLSRSHRMACALAMALLVSGCADNPSSPNRSATTSHSQPDPIERPPHVGMTKNQVLAQYGEPRVVNVTDRGEVWRYVLNLGEIATKALIPFYPPVRPRFGVVVFGPDDRVTRYQWQPDPEN